MNDRTDAILASIDGALADDELRDGMRWSPEPEKVTGAPEPFDGSLVWQPPQSYEDAGTSLPDSLSHAEPPHDLAEHLPVLSARRGGVQFRRFTEAEPADHTRHVHTPLGRGQVPDLVIHDDTYLVDPAHRAEVQAERRTDVQRLLDSAESAALIRADLHQRAQRLQADARAALPRRTVVNDHRPGLAFDVNAGTPSGLLIVEEYASGLTTVRRATPDERAEVINAAWRALADAFAPVFEAVGDTMRRLGEAFRGTGLATEQRVRRDLDTEEGRRAAALDARRHRHTGPPPLGPERSPRPRRHR